MVKKNWARKVDRDGRREKERERKSERESWEDDKVSFPDLIIFFRCPGIAHLLFLPVCLLVPSLIVCITTIYSFHPFFSGGIKRERENEREIEKRREKGREKCGVSKAGMITITESDDDEGWGLNLRFLRRRSLCNQFSPVQQPHFSTPHT